MTRSTGPLGLTAVGALLLSLTACTSAPEVNTSQASTTRELVLVQGEDATSRALGHAYRDMLEAAGIQAKLAEPAADPVAEVLAGHADVTLAGSGELLAALELLPEATGEPSEADGGRIQAPGAETGAEAGSAAATALDAAQTRNQLDALALGDFAVLDSAEAERTGALVVTAATSAGEQLTGVEALAPLCRELEFGIAAADAAQLATKLATTLGCTPGKVVELTAPNARSVLPVITDAVQVQAVTAGNAGIVDNALVVLENSGSLFAPQVLTALITTREVGQDAITAINELSGALKQDDLLELDRMATGRDAVDPERAATDWLADKGLSGTGS